MSKNLTLTIRTPEKEVFSGKVKSVKMITEQGLLIVLPKHASLTGAVSFSPLVFTDEKGNEENFVVRRGIVMVSNKHNAIDVMTFTCERKSEISPTSAKEYLAFVKKELEKGTDLSDFQIKFYEEEKYVIEKQIGYLEKTGK